MGEVVNLNAKDTVQRAEIQSQELGRVTADLEALCWSLDEGLRKARLASADASDLADLEQDTKRAAEILKAFDNAKEQMRRLEELFAGLAGTGVVERLA